MEGEMFSLGIQELYILLIIFGVVFVVLFWPKIRKK